MRSGSARSIAGADIGFAVRAALASGLAKKGGGHAMAAGVTIARAIKLEDAEENLGAQLARLEIRMLFEELAKRYPRIEALGPPDRLRSNFIGGIKHLPVRLSA